MMEKATMNKEQVADLAAAVVALMVGYMNGDDDGNGKLRWDHAVFAATLGIKSVASVAMQIDNLSDEQVREAVFAAMASALSTDIRVKQVESKEEFERLSKENQSAKRGRH